MAFEWKFLISVSDPSPKKRYIISARFPTQLFLRSGLSDRLSVSQGTRRKKRKKVFLYINVKGTLGFLLYIIIHPLPSVSFAHYFGVCHGFELSLALGGGATLGAWAPIMYLSQNE